eukprot:5744879-Amphidinium_carterae.1
MMKWPLFWKAKASECNFENAPFFARCGSAIWALLAFVLNTVQTCYPHMRVMHSLASQKLRLCLLSRGTHLQSCGFRHLFGFQFCSARWAPV